MLSIIISTFLTVTIASAERACHFESGAVGQNLRAQMKAVQASSTSPAVTRALLKKLYNQCFNNSGHKKALCPDDQVKRLEELMTPTEPRVSRGGTPKGEEPNANRTLKPSYKDAWGIEGEVLAAKAMAHTGYEIHYAGDKNGLELRAEKNKIRSEEKLKHSADFDFIVQGRSFDAYSPEPYTRSARVAESVIKKIESQQTQRVIIYAGTRAGSEIPKISNPEELEALRDLLHVNPPENLREVLIATGTPDYPVISRLYP